MREAIENIYSQRTEIQGKMSADRRRMDGMRFGGQVLFDTADKLLKSFGHHVEMQPMSGEGLPKHLTIMTDPVLITFPYPDGNLGQGAEIEAELHLLAHPQVQLPEGDYKPGVMLLGQFAGLEGDSNLLFAFAEDGSVLNHKGDYVTEQEMIQAENILTEMYDPQSQIDNEIVVQLEIFNDPEARAKLNAAFDIWLKRVDANEPFFGKLHITNAEMVAHLQEQTPIGKREIKGFEEFMREQNMNQDDLARMIIGNFGNRTVNQLVEDMPSDELENVQTRPIDDDYVQRIVTEAVKDYVGGEHATRTAEAIKDFFKGLNDKMKVGESLNFDMFQPDDEQNRTGLRIEMREEGLMIVRGDLVHSAQRVSDIDEALAPHADGLREALKFPESLEQ